MNTIRRIYVYTVCLISLQWAAISIKSLMDAALRWVLVGQRSDLTSLVFPLAVVIVGTPVFLGHWLWAQWLAQRDSSEQPSLTRQLYLAVTQTLLTAYIAVALYAGVEGFLRLVMLFVSPGLLSRNYGNLPTARSFALADCLSSLATLAVTLGLWLYYRRVSARDGGEMPAGKGKVSGVLDYLISLGFAVLGGGLSASGIFGLQLALYRLPQSHSLGGFSSSAGFLAAGAALWAVHERFVRRSPESGTGYKRLLRGLSLQGFSLVGLILTIAGVVGLQQWLLLLQSKLNGPSLPVSAAQLTTGLVLLLYHELALRRFLDKDFRNPLRSGYGLLANLAGLIMAVSGAQSFLGWLFGGFRITYAAYGAATLLPGFLLWAYYEWETEHVQGPVRRLRDQLYNLAGWWIALLGLSLLQSWLMGFLASIGADLQEALPVLLTGLAMLVYYEVRLRQGQEQDWLKVRWLIAFLAHSLGVVFVAIGLFNTLSWLFHPRLLARFPFPEAATFLLPGAALWLFFVRVLRQNQAQNVTLLTRLAVYAFSGMGVGLSAIGLVGVQEWLFGRVTGDNLVWLNYALACLATGFPIWLYFWRWAERLFNSGEAAEQKSDLRKTYLFVIIYLTVNVAVFTIGLLLNGLFLNLLGIPTQGGLSLLLAVLIVSTAMWVYHALVLHGDIRRAGETSLQGNLQRLYWYLVAAVGLLAGVIGAAGSLGALFRLLAAVFSGEGAPVFLRQQLAASLAACLAGLPVWASAWFPAQRRATQPGEAGLRMRRSILRKGYLYLYLLGATLTVLIFAIRTVFQLLRVLLGLSAEAHLLAQIGESLAFTIIGAVLWVYHIWVLRGDSRLEKQERAVETEQAAALKAQALADQRQKWALFPIVIVDNPAGGFAAPVAAEIALALPHLTVRVVDAALQPNSDAIAEGESPPPGLIIAPWSVAYPGSPVAELQVNGLLVPTPAERFRWVGLYSDGATLGQVIQALRQALPAQPPEPPEPIEIPAPPEKITI